MRLFVPIVLIAPLPIPHSPRLAPQQQQFDVLIRGGRILDGTGNPWFRADVGIRADRIAAIGDLRNATATRVIDAASWGLADLIVVNGNPLEDLKVLYPTGTETIRDGKVVKTGGVEWTIKDGIPYHGPTLLREVKELVAQARIANGRR